MTPSMAHRVSVLLVDDDDECRALYRDVLHLDGYLVTEASNGNGALHACRHDPPWLIVLDCMTPRLNGLALLSTLAACERWSSIPIIFASGPEGPDPRHLGFHLVGFHRNPMSPQDLITMVRSCSQKQPQRTHAVSIPTRR